MHPHLYIHIYICICIYVYVYIYMCVCVCIYVYTHRHVETHTHIYIYVNVYLCIHIPICSYMHTYILSTEKTQHKKAIKKNHTQRTTKVTTINKTWRPVVQLHVIHDKSLFHCGLRALKYLWWWGWWYWWWLCLITNSSHGMMSWRLLNPGIHHGSKLCQ